MPEFATAVLPHVQSAKRTTDSMLEEQRCALSCVGDARRRNVFRTLSDYARQHDPSSSPSSVLVCVLSVCVCVCVSLFLRRCVLTRRCLRVSARVYFFVMRNMKLLCCSQQINIVRLCVRVGECFVSRCSAEVGKSIYFLPKKIRSHDV